MEEQEKLEQIKQKSCLKVDSPTMERLILAYLYKDKSTFLRLAKYLETKNWGRYSHFKDSCLQFILNFMCSLNRKYKKVPTLEEFDTAIEHQLKNDPDLQKKIKNITREIAAQEFDTDTAPSSEYVKDFLVDFIKRERAVEATLLNQMDIENNKYELLSSRMQEAVNVNLDKDLGTDIDDYQMAYQMIQEVEKSNETGMSWGSKMLNGDLGLLQAGELGLVAGVPGGGKTLILQHFALANYSRGKNVVVFSFEVSEQRLLSRYYKNLLSVSTKELIEFTPDQLEKRLKEKERGRLKLINRPANTCSSNDMSAILRDLEVYENFVPDLIVVDYILITATNEKKAMDNSYKYYKTVSEELRNLAMEFKCPLISGVQLNRNALASDGIGSKDVVSAKDIAESKGVLDTCDYLLVIQQTANDKIDKNALKLGKHLGTYRLRIEKNRNGSNGRTVKFDVNWDTLTLVESEIQDKDAKKDN